MATSKILQYRHKTLKDGTHPIVLQIIHNEKAKRYSIARPCLPEQWNPNKEIYGSKMPNYKNLNFLLTKERKKVNDIITKLTDSEKPFTFEALDRLYKGIARPTSLYGFIETLILELAEKGRIGNKNVYLDTLRALKAYKSTNSLQPEDIDYNFLKGFEHFLTKRGTGNGGISVYMRTLRAIINEAINRSYLHRDFYPFTKSKDEKGKYNIRKLKSKYNPRGLSLLDIEKIKLFDTDLNSHLRRSQFYFLFSYFSGGMNFTDMAYLESKEIRGERINYNRRKVNTGLSVYISEPIRNILDYFVSIKPTENNYIFPILDSEIHKSPQQQKDRIKKCLKEYNLNLKEIQRQLGIQDNLTSYSARHSFAQTLKNKGVSHEIISQKLGHADLKTTNHYLKRLPDDDIDKVDQLL